MILNNCFSRKIFLYGKNVFKFKQFLKRIILFETLFETEKNIFLKKFFIQEKNFMKNIFYSAELRHRSVSN